jgi:hypothetical protein
MLAWSRNQIRTLQGDLSVQLTEEREDTVATYHGIARLDLSAMANDRIGTQDVDGRLKLLFSVPIDPEQDTKCHQKALLGA